MIENQTLFTRLKRNAKLIKYLYNRKKCVASNKNLK